eukprot:6279668-Pyramimonas_sp.AAC.1
MKRTRSGLPVPEGGAELGTPHPVIDGLLNGPKKPSKLTKKVPTGPPELAESTGSSSSRNNTS